MKGLILKENCKDITKCKKYSEFACCEAMLRDLFVGTCEFDLTYKCFYIHIKEPKQVYWRGLGFCTHCGKKLPDLDGADRIYDNCLEQAVGKELYDITEEEIPPEFKTDEWWRKRGL